MYVAFVYNFTDTIPHPFFYQHPHPSCTRSISQSNLGQVALINPFQSLLYTWDDPTKPRELVWNVYNNKKSGYDAKFEKVRTYYPVTCFVAKCVKRVLQCEPLSFQDGCGQEIVPLVLFEKCNSLSSASSFKSNSKSTWLESKSTSFSSSENTCDEEMKAATSKHAQVEKTIVYWVSYMEGNQRVLLFTQQETVFLKAKNIIDRSKH